MPGSEESFTIEEFRQVLNTYKNIGDLELRTHLYQFIQAIAPVAEQAGINLAIHPDDPPYPILGLPRVVSTENDAMLYSMLTTAKQTDFVFVPVPMAFVQIMIFPVW